MSKVDMSVFEELMEFHQADSLSELLYAMCSGDIYFGADYEWENEWPSYDLYKSDRVEYDRLSSLRENERVEKYEPHCESVRLKYGYEHLEQEGGGEGGAEDCHGVFKLGDKYYKASYRYYSHHGHDYDDIESTLHEVTPSEVTITVYK